MQEVLDFIEHFKGAENTFLHGCCYWFAWILKERFHKRGWFVLIYHDPVVGHFIAQFIPDYVDASEYKESDVRYFDIRGDVTDIYDGVYLENMTIMANTEERRWGRLMCDCKYFIDPEDDRYPKYLEN